VTEPLREPQSLSLAYERPTQAWVCGRAAEGNACPFGPSPTGRCGATSECVPRRQGDRWECTRPESRGGPCADGPRPDGKCGRPIPPCQPVRSLRARRGLLVFGSVAFSVGLLLFLLGGSNRDTVLSPGELTFRHGTVAQSCATCHAGQGGDIGSLLRAAVEPKKAAAQNQLCMECHQLGEFGARPHGLSPSQLEERKQHVHPSTASAPFLMTAAQRGLGVPTLPDGDLACSSCHQEHQGRHANLSFMDDQRCQACHAQQFTSLSRGHPEFVDYPFHQRTSLFFDHESHMGRHFKDFQETNNVRAPESCAACHEPDPTGRMMLVKDFAQTCAACHLPQILDVTLGGVRFLNLPGLDVETLRRQEEFSTWVEPMTALTALPGQGPSPALALAALFRDERLVVQPPFDVGEWPAAAAGQPTPFLQLLLSADRDYAATRAALQGVDLRDLRGANPAQLRAAGALLWGVKGLFYDLIRDGNQALTGRLGRLAGTSPSAEELVLLTGDLPPSAVLEAQKRWLPELLTEVPVHRAVAGKGKPAPATPPREKSGPSQPSSERWRRDDNDCSLQYLPRRHTDLFLHGWLDFTGRRYATAASPPDAALFDVLANPYEPGRCTKCHSVEANADGSRTVHWSMEVPQPGQRPFTTFAHQPHFSLVAEKQCQTCHSFQKGSHYQDAFLTPDHRLNTDPHKFDSNFVPMSRALCSECHTAEKAGASCLICHNYHTGSFTPFKTPVSQFKDLRSRSLKFQSPTLNGGSGASN
jgi:hypothetical protein